MMKRTFLWSAVALSLLAGSVAFAAPTPAIDRYTVELPAHEYLTAPGQTKHAIPLGYGSALTYKGTTRDGAIEFYGVTDRGPNLDSVQYHNGDQKLSSKIFPVPDYAPRIGIIRVKDGKATVVSSFSLKNKAGQDISGRPIPQGALGNTGEIGLDLQFRPLAYDKNGLDPEGLAVDAQGHFWLTDEYGPFLVEYDRQGRELRRLAPGQGLPKILQERQPNRGAEGLAITPAGKLMVMMQSTLNVGGKTKNIANFTRLVLVDPKSGDVKTYAYPITPGSYKKNSAMKLGDIAAINDHQFLVIEQGKDAQGTMQNRIYKIDIAKATDITDMTSGQNALEADKDALGKLFQPVQKDLFLDLRQHGWTVEKAEGIVLLPDKKTLAIANDNDFGIALKIEGAAAGQDDITEYTYDAEQRILRGADGTPTRIRATMTEGPDPSVLWLIHLPQPL